MDKLKTLIGEAPHEMEFRLLKRKLRREHERVTNELDRFHSNLTKKKAKAPALRGRAKAEAQAEAARQLLLQALKEAK